MYFMDLIYDFMNPFKCGWLIGALSMKTADLTKSGYFNAVSMEALAPSEYPTNLTLSKECSSQKALMSAVNTS
ncbi:hypothetical protein WICPIJ_003168 [Wickerhamomyces pijperi]|uniref:Uncharacterized protein n=1 Tax=Wickerhamomyces pijperi TaxID=599730 RepID=A0A9P8TP58_WICPI|nr:hypothetical protein WICPIJ_003168 [Wickerhamomyces pijperi]